MPPEALLPTGRVTIVFTDIENSSRMASDLGDAAYFDQLRNPHQQILLDGFQRHRGVAVHTAGDSFMAVFQDADDALACATTIQQRLTAEPLTATGKTRSWTLRVRIGVHTTEQDIVPGKLAWIPDADFVAGQVEYSGTDTNFAARIASLGAAGQIIVSHSTYRAAEMRAQHAWQAWPNRRLKSFEAAPETVWELLYDRQSRGEPGSRWVPDWYRGELNRYIARPELQQTVVSHFKTGRDNVRRRLVTLYAEGGMGKSRLAVACAIEMVALFQHGVTFVNLARDEDDGSRRTRESVAQEIGLALGLAGQDLNPNQLLDSLKSAERLLVLDNYESVDGQDVRLFIRDLIARTSSLCLLVTSRTPVNLPDVEQIVSLGDGMTEAQARSLFLAYVALTGRGPDWTPDADDERDLARVLTLTERIPLAVELAAAWAGSRSIKEIADGLQKTPLGRMSRTPGDADRADPSPHHYSLTRSLDWSYGLLDETARAAFAPLCLFADSFTDEAVAALLSQDQEDAEDVLDHLHRVSLVRRTESKKESRYSLHRFTREYANIKLSALPEVNTVRERFVAYYCRLFTQNGNFNNGLQRSVLMTEWRNILAAIHVAQIQEDWISIKVLAELGEFMNLRGLWSEQNMICLVALVASKQSGNRAWEGTALLRLGHAFLNNGNFDAAEQVNREGLALFQEIDDLTGQAWALCNIGNVCKGKCLWPQAEQACTESITLFREVSERRGEGFALRTLGWIYRWQEDWDKAEQAFQASAIISQELDMLDNLAWSFAALGEIYIQTNRWNEAKDRLERSSALFRELELRLGIGQTLINLAELMQAQEKWEDAVIYAREAVAVLEQTEHTSVLVNAQELLEQLTSR